MTVTVAGSTVDERQAGREVRLRAARSWTPGPETADLGPNGERGRRRCRSMSAIGPPIVDEALADRQPVVEAAPAGPTSTIAGVERPRRGDRPDRDRDLTGDAAADRQDARRAGSSATSFTTSWVAPLIWIGSVSASVRPRIWSASPSTETSSGIDGDRLDPIAAGGRAAEHGRDRQRPRPEVLNTAIRTWAVDGSTSTGVSRSPRASTGMRSTSRSTSRPLGSMTTSARTSMTRSTTEAGPQIDTVPGVTTLGRTSRPSGVGPWMTRTGIPLRILSGSSVT